MAYNDPYRNSRADMPYEDHNPAYQTSASTEKMVDRSSHLPSDEYGHSQAGAYNGENDAQMGMGGTERVQKGRQGLQAPPMTWAEMGPPPRSTGILRMWRKDERGKQWSRGGGLRSALRLCCCCVTLTVIIILSVVLTLALYVRPPSLKLNSINIGNYAVNAGADSFSVSIGLGISVANPNWFNVDFKEITADVTYPGTSANFGSGSLKNVNFAGHTSSTFDFPLDLQYSTDIDPNRIILSDLISKCGTSRSEITVDYALNLKLRILSFVIPFNVNSAASFDCPISATDIQRIGAGSG